MILAGITAVLFDNDGVLVDSKQSVIEAWSEWGRRLFGEFTYPKNFHGRRAEEIVRDLVDEKGFESANQLINTLELELANQTKPLAGAVELTQSIPDGLWNVCTSANAELGRARLTAAGIDFPEQIVTADDVTNGKPNPEPYALGARRLGIDSANCLVLEDAVAGIESGRASGAGLVIGVGEEILELTEKEMVITDLRGINYIDGEFHLNEDYRLR